MKRLPARRERLGWSQAELAERTKVSRDTVGRIERGRLREGQQVALLPSRIPLGERARAGAAQMEATFFPAAHTRLRGPQLRPEPSTVVV